MAACALRNDNDTKFTGAVASRGEVTFRLPQTVRSFWVAVYFEAWKSVTFGGLLQYI
jgi:hypothetical protein